MSYCENCGQFLRDDAAHCPNCGTANPEYVAPAPQPEPARQPQEPAWQPQEPVEAPSADPTYEAPVEAPRPKTNVMAIIGFVASIIPVFSGVISLILSIIALVQIKKKDFEKPLKGLAVAGLILSILGLVFCVILIVLAIVLFTSGVLTDYLS